MKRLLLLLHMPSVQLQGWSLNVLPGSYSHRPVHFTQWKSSAGCLVQLIELCSHMCLQGCGFDADSA